MIYIYNRPHFFHRMKVGTQASQLASDVRINVVAGQLRKIDLSIGGRSHRGILMDGCDLRNGQLANVVHGCNTRTRHYQAGGREGFRQAHQLVCLFPCSANFRGILILQDKHYFTLLFRFLLPTAQWKKKLQIFYGFSTDQKHKSFASQTETLVHLCIYHAQHRFSQCQKKKIIQYSI